MTGLLECRCRAIDAWIPSTGTRPLAVPKTRVAISVRLGPLAAHVLHHATDVRSLLSACLELVVFVASTAVMNEAIRVHARPADTIQIGLRQVARCERHERFRDPVGM